ncbi:MAG: glycine cleavage system protein GcvH [Novosphingobium sp.]|nr:glycine cleavage system protein GcvH [Novosphingobium sp.]
MSRHFTKDHEWIDVSEDVGTVGITDYAQSQLGDITFVELPEVGSTVGKSDSVSVVDSVKAASDVYTPVSGEVVAVNDALADEPEKVNTDAEGEGWLFRVSLSDPGELDSLMDEAAYTTYIAGL